MSPRVTAIVCTHNRLDRLPAALASLDGQTLPANWYEVILVDNHSMDGTEEWFKSRSPSRAHITYFREPVLGLSVARNRGLALARSAIVAYLDDDAVAAPDWLEVMVEAMAQLPRAGCIGGKVFPIWEGARPRWLSDELLPVLSVVDWGNSRKEIGGGHFLAGTNIAYRKDVLCGIGGFPTGLGRKGSKLLSNEETYVTGRMAERGWPAIYEPRMQVRHLIPATRMRKMFFFRRYYWQGLSDAGSVRQATPRWKAGSRLRFAARSVKRGAGIVLGSLWRCGRGVSGAWFLLGCNSLRCAGTILGAFRRPD